MRRAIEQLVLADERRRVDTAFAEGFARCPEDEADIRDARRLAIEAIEDEPWEKWW